MATGYLLLPASRNPAPGEVSIMYLQVEGGLEDGYWLPPPTGLPEPGTRHPAPGEVSIMYLQVEGGLEDGYWLPPPTGLPEPGTRHRARPL